MRGEPLDHVLLHGSPGAWKDYPCIYNRKRNGRKYAHNIGSGDRKAGRSCALLTNLDENDILFVRLRFIV